tara:strand:+ start:2043 stop:3692 length:1650 start_codon:yes stop_codon:yes gene_type:complete
MIKIGVLIKDFNELRNFELRILKYIIDDPELELSVLFKDGRKLKNNSNLFYKIIRHIKRGNFLSKGLLILQQYIENKLFRVIELNGKENIIRILEETEQILLNPERKGFLDIFSDEESKLIEGYNLDLILRFEFDIIRGKILNSSKNGIWSFHHGDNKVNRGGPSCFWEIILNQKSIGVTLQKLTPELDGGLIIDKAFYNRHWSWVKTRQLVLESSVSLLLKNINKLKRNTIELSDSGLYYYPLYKFPSIYFSIKYLYIFYSNIILRIFRRLNVKVFKAKYSSWTLIISKGNFFNAVLHKLKPVRPPSNEFWADPFIVTYKNEDYVFFENYQYSRKKGKISCGKLVNNNLTEIIDVLDKDYHLSYPSVFIEKEEFFMIPETNQNKRLEIYKCVSFPDKWELYSSAFEGEEIVDCNYYKDEMDQQWLFLNKKLQNSDGCSDLYIYLIDSLRLNSIKPHFENPVITNSNLARNAGPIFKYRHKIYRPSQINNEGIYGRGLNINEILKLNIEEYKEITVKKCLPFFNKNIQGIHHLHQKGDTFVTDICYKKK